MDEPIEKTQNRRFVVLHHQFPAASERADHWDLMLESESSLLTWALSEFLEPGKSIRAMVLADHRKSYLDYQGQISGNRGSVSRVMHGDFVWKSGSNNKQLVLNSEARQLEIEFLGDGKELLIIVRTPTREVSTPTTKMR